MFGSFGKKVSSGIHNLSNLGKKVVNSVGNSIHTIGKKVSDIAVKVGHRGAHIAHQVGNIAGKYVAPISGAISKGTLMGAAALAATGVGAPVAGALSSISRVAGTVNKGVRAVASGSRIAERGFQMAEKVGRAGQFIFK